VTVDLMVGFRVNSVALDLSLSPGLLPAQRLGVSETWVDPLIGARGSGSPTGGSRPPSLTSADSGPAPI
jgi:hypothetical protein